MKMRTVIEAGRKASPLVGQALEAACTQLEELVGNMSDLANVRSDAARSAMVNVCTKGLADLHITLGYLGSKWREFDETLGEYRYKFKQPKSKVVKDLPGQQMLFNENAPSCV